MKFRLVPVVVVMLVLAVVLATQASVAVDEAAAVEPVLQDEVTFTVTIENISAGSQLPGPLSPGVWAVHDTSVALFNAVGYNVDVPEAATPELEALAEDGDAAGLASALGGVTGILDSGVFSGTNGLLLPGDATSFTFTTSDPDAVLSLATMLVQSNDAFLAPDPRGLPLFVDGAAITTTEATMILWDAGTEKNEAPGMGPNQAPRQAAPNTGPAENTVSQFSNTTRALPLAAGIVDVTVTEDAESFIVRVENVFPDQGAIFTPISPVFYATHAADWAGFVTEGEAAPVGLEALAEDGDAAGLRDAYDGTAGVDQVGIANAATGAAERGPALPGQAYEFAVTPTADTPNLSIATMVVESNDAFIAFDLDGVALLDEAGNPRPAEAINAEIRGALAVWDAGTEANEVPGVGLNQAPRQSAPGTGEPDEDATVRRYVDSTNDLAGEMVGGFLDVSVVGGDEEGEFLVEVTNTSANTAYPGSLTTIAVAMHDENTTFFAEGMPVPENLRILAEDGDPIQYLSNELAGAGFIENTVIGEAPIGPGASYEFNIKLDETHRFFNMAAMIVPSNDTFVSFGPAGIELLDTTGTPRDDEAVAEDVAALLGAWDAGSELNQAGAMGPDQPPRQAGPDTGASDGNGAIRAMDDGVWTYPLPGNVIRVTITTEE